MDGLTDFEETNWWNPDVRKGYHRPGSGVLASVLAEELHNRSLFSIVATPPPSQAIPAVQQQSSDIPPPSKGEIMASLPHPNAYYCPEENGWVVLIWMSSSSSFATLLAQPYFNNPDFPLLYDWRRQQKVSCVMTGNLHHFHRYEKAVDGHKLTPPFCRTITTTQMDASYWKGPTTESDFTQYKKAKILTESSTETAGDEDGRLDLSVCCQCPFYCVTSKVIHGVIPVEDMEELVQDKRCHVPQGWSRERAVVRAFETLLTVIENKLWKGNNRMLKVTCSSFQINLGWNLSIRHIFTLLGFVEAAVEGSPVLMPPGTDQRTLAGRENRRKLLRAWVEFSAWLLNFRHLIGGNERKLYVELNSAKEMYLTAIGAYPDQDALLNDKIGVVRPLEAALRVLGLSPTTFSGDLTVFAYLAQCRCDPARIPEYFSSLLSIVTHLQEHGNCPSRLQDLLTVELSRGRFTLEDIRRASLALGFGVGNILDIEYDANLISEELVEKAWKGCIKRSWRDFEGGSKTSRLCTKAFKVLAEARGSVRLRKLWEDTQNGNI
ncbi:hypothetical protein GALMADRAFT_906169 [Galerina marginata CBS 339.88]|uniref:Uncharacterized protein n=1 Tax=Galerina marginata (strain CBS 339.88) TaxID=685588 RepID=A0A067SGN2_GALM3|nr:hypothetical protein GALMADRAFT_906169 [Galerina marginata CBS 339.88]